MIKLQRRQVIIKVRMEDHTLLKNQLVSKFSTSRRTFLRLSRRCLLPTITEIPKLGMQMETEMEKAMDTPTIIRLKNQAQSMKEVRQWKIKLSFLKSSKSS